MASDAAPRTSARARIAALACGAAIAAAAAVPRFVGIEVGRVLSAAHPDELPVATAQWMLRHGEPSLPLVAYGGGYHVPLQLVLRALSGFGVESPASAVAWVAEDAQLGSLLPLRLWSAALSTAAVAAVFAAGRAAAGTAAGAIAALILAAAPAAIRDAHLAKADAAATLAAALVIASLAGARERSAAGAVALGCATGLAISTKYAVGLLPAAALAAWWDVSVGRGSPRRLLVFAAALCATAVALNSFWLFHPAACWRLLREFLDTHSQYARMPFLAGWVRPLVEYHAMVSLRYGCGAAAAVLAGPALIAAWMRRGATRWIALAAAGQFAVLLANPFEHSRNFAPIVPALAVAIGALVAGVARRVGQGAGRAAIAVAAVALAVPAWDGLRMARVLRETDTRGLAADWIAAHVPAGSALIGFGGPLGASWGLPDVGDRRLLRGVDPAHWSGAAGFVVRYRYPIAWAAQELPSGASLGAPLAVFDPFAPGADPVVEPIDAFYLPLARFAGVERPGPRIEIYSTGAETD